MSAFGYLPRATELGDPRRYLARARLVDKLHSQGYTMLGSRNARALIGLAEDVEAREVPGVVVDCGVYNGGSTVLMSLGAPSRVAWAFDSFEGLPKAAALDGAASAEWVGECRGSEKKVRAGFEAYSDPSRLRIAKGWFEDSFARFAVEIDQIALLHIDADWYDSILLALETFYPKLSPGGYVAVDDLNFWPGARRAVDEYRARHEIKAPIAASYHWRKA